MTLPLTPEMLAAAYDYLKVTPPFDKWNLPEPDEVKFRVSRNKRDYGSYRWDGEQHVVTMSANLIGYSGTLFRCLAHEMVHMHLEETDMESRTGGRDTHNGAFCVLADEVCKFHGFDPKAFY